MALVNRTKDPLEIKIVHADGRKDSVNLHRKIMALPPGAIVDPDYAKTYESVMTDTTKVAPRPAASAPAPAPTK